MAIKTRSIKRKESIKQYSIAFKSTAGATTVLYNVVVPFDSVLREIITTATAACICSVADIINITKSASIASAVSLGAIAAKGSVVKAKAGGETIIKAGDLINYSVSATATLAKEVCLVLEKV